MQDVDITVTMKIVTCSCGFFYAVPYWSNHYGCPACSYGTIERRRLQSDRLQRQLTAMKGTVTKLRKRAKRGSL